MGYIMDIEAAELYTLDVYQNGPLEIALALASNGVLLTEEQMVSASYTAREYTLTSGWTDVTGHVGVSIPATAFGDCSWMKGETSYSGNFRYRWEAGENSLFKTRGRQVVVSLEFTFSDGSRTVREIICNVLDK